MARWGLRPAPLLAVTLALAACGADDAGGPTLGKERSTDPGGRRERLALSGGRRRYRRVRLRDRCLYVGSPSGERSTAVWPPGSRPVVEDGKPGVQVPGFGPVLAGQIFRAGGGAAGPEPGETPALQGSCVEPGGVTYAIHSIHEIIG